MKCYYVVNARLPTEKAHGIQIAKMCEAFIETGVDLTLVVPRRATDPRSVREFYGLRVEIPLVRLPVCDGYAWGRLGYALGSVTFMISSLLFLWRRKRAGESFYIYTVDLDTFSSSALAMLGCPLYSEYHHARKATLPERWLFTQARGIIAINRIIASELRTQFPQTSAAFLIEPNGVDLEQFRATDKRTARHELGLPQEVPLVLYTGQFFEWKGLEILPRAAAHTPQIHWYILGGDAAAFRAVVREAVPHNVHFPGHRPHGEMPLWYAAADAVIVLGTKRDIQSYTYTSPMKLFECFAMERPIIASRTPALLEVVTEEEVVFYEPDTALDLARQVDYVLTHSPELKAKIEASRQRARTSSWSARADRILGMIHHTLREQPTDLYGKH